LCGLGQSFGLPVFSQPLPDALLCLFRHWLSGGGNASGLGHWERLPGQNGHGGGDGLKGDLNVLALIGQPFLLTGDTGEGGFEFSLLGGQGLRDDDIDWVMQFLLRFRANKCAATLSLRRDLRESKKTCSLVGNGETLRADVDASPKAMRPNTTVLEALIRNLRFRAEL